MLFAERGGRDSLDLQRLSLLGEAAAPDLLDFRHGDEGLRVDLLDQLRGGEELPVGNDAEHALLLLLQASGLDHGHGDARLQILQQTMADLLVPGRNGEDLEVRNGFLQGRQG